MIMLNFVKMPTIVCILTFSVTYIGVLKHEKLIFQHFIFELLKFHAEFSMKKVV